MWETVLFKWRREMSDYQDREYEDVCIICRRPESKAGRMFHLPSNITVCDDCMHKTMETVSHMDMNGMFPNMGYMDMQAFMNSMNKANASDVQKKSEKVKKDESEQIDADDVKERDALETVDSDVEAEDIVDVDELEEDDVDEDIEEEDAPEDKKVHGSPFGF